MLRLNFDEENLLIQSAAQLVSINDIRVAYSSFLNCYFTFIIFPSSMNYKKLRSTFFFRQVHVIEKLRPTFIDKDQCDQSPPTTDPILVLEWGCIALCYGMLKPIDRR